MFRSNIDLRETTTQFIQHYEDIILRFLSIQSLFNAEQILPIYLVASLSPINKTKDYAELSIRSLLSTVDTKNDL